MAKDPAFLFYPNDYLGGTLGMTFEEKGAYIELLMLQFNRGHMTSHMVGQTVGQIWVNIQDKFKVDTKGLFYNERLEMEQKKRKAFTGSRKNNLLGKNQHTKNDKKRGHMTSHMEYENENVNDNVIISDITDFEIGKTIEFVRLSGGLLLTFEQVKNFWLAFIIHAEGEVHENASDKIQHFRNWLKKQKINQNAKLDSSRPNRIREPL